MTQQHLSHRILAGALTFVGLGLVWMAIVSSLPTHQELSAKEPSMLQRSASAGTSTTVTEPALDLSIPGVSPGPPPPGGPHQPPAVSIPSAAAQLGTRAAQVARLRCEAEAAQLCPDVPEGPARKQCLEKRASQLPVSCQHQFQERLVKWKEERNRLMASCQIDMKRYCPAVSPGEGQVLHCLQQHAQELSDNCYAMLPKGTLYFKQ